MKPFRLPKLPELGCDADWFRAGLPNDVAIDHTFPKLRAWITGTRDTFSI
jgi:hypothetical protein